MSEETIEERLVRLSKFPLFFDKTGKQIDVHKWVELTENRKYRTIAQDTTEAGIYVSTVWTGLNMGFGDGPPIIFETMAFDMAGNSLEQWRYRTEAEAIDGHKRTLQDMRRWDDEDPDHAHDRVADR